MKYVLIIKADTNDGDYVSEQTDVTLEEVEAIKPVIEAIKAFDANEKKERGYRCNWPSSEYADGSIEEQYGHLGEELLETFKEYCPYGEYGVHTIESIVLMKVEEVIQLL